MEGCYLNSSNTESVSPRFLFIMVVIMIYLFVVDDSLTSKRFTARTEQLTKYCEPLQKMRLRRYICCGSICFTFWG